MGFGSVRVLAHFTFRFISVFGKIWVPVWFVLASFWFFLISNSDSYSTHGIPITITVAAVPSDHFSPFTMICSVTWLSAEIINVFVHNLFPCSPGPASLSGSLNFQSNTFFIPSSSFLKTYHLGLFLYYFFIPLLLCLLFLSVALALGFELYLYWGIVY